MNHLLTRLAGLGLAATVLLTSCEKDEDQVVIQPSGTVALTSSASSVVLSQANADKPAVTYSWNAASFGYSAATSYTLQFDKKGGNFSAPMELVVGNATTRTLTVSELNNQLLKLKLAPGSSSQVDVRVRASVGGNAAPMTSAVSTITATPYLVFVEYPQIFVPGSYQGWAPDKAPFLASVASNQQYEGFINFPTANTMFKFTPARNWDNDFGDDGTKTGKLKAKGSDITIADPGYYRFKVNTNALTYEFVKTSWSIIGSSTANGWNADTPLTYDATRMVWTATLPLTVGEVKFRANNAWDINFGDGNAGATPAVAPDGIPDYGADNIKVTSAGTYTVTLDLSKGAGNYTYSLSK